MGKTGKSKRSPVQLLPTDILHGGEASFIEMRFRQELTLHVINSFGATNVRVRITQVMLLFFRFTCCSYCNMA